MARAAEALAVTEANPEPEGAPGVLPALSSLQAARAPAGRQAPALEDRWEQGGHQTTPAGFPPATPPCIEDLLEQCPSIGRTCTQGTSGTNTVKCYSNGLKDVINAVETMATRLAVTATSVSRSWQRRSLGEDYYDAQGTYAGRVADTASSTRYLVTCADGGPSP